jgi:serine protease Do
MIFSPSGGSVGIGFAIPSSTSATWSRSSRRMAKWRAAGSASKSRSDAGIAASSHGLEGNQGSNRRHHRAGRPGREGRFPARRCRARPQWQIRRGFARPDARVARCRRLQSAVFTSCARDGQNADNRQDRRPQEDDRSLPTRRANSQPARRAKRWDWAWRRSRRTCVAPINLDDHVARRTRHRVDPNSDAADKGIEPGDVVVVSVATRACTRRRTSRLRLPDAQSQGRKSVLVLVRGQQRSALRRAEDRLGLEFDASLPYRTARAFAPCRPAPAPVVVAPSPPLLPPARTLLICGIRGKSTNEDHMPCAFSSLRTISRPNAIWCTA